MLYICVSLFLQNHFLIIILFLTNNIFGNVLYCFLEGENLYQSYSANKM